MGDKLRKRFNTAENKSHLRMYFNSETSSKVILIEDEAEGIKYSVVPFLKKKKGMSKIDPKKYTWSTNNATNRGTITRDDFYASGKWNQIPASSQIPDPPTVWGKSKILKSKIQNPKNP